MDHSTEVVHLPMHTSDGTRELARRYQERREVTQRDAYPLAKPEHVPPDGVGFLGRKRESALVRQHNEQLDRIDYAGEELRYAVQEGTRLELWAVRDAAFTAAAEVAIYEQQRPQSLEAAILQQIVLGSAERIEGLVADAGNEYRRRTLR